MTSRRPAVRHQLLFLITGDEWLLDLKGRPACGALPTNKITPDLVAAVPEPCRAMLNLVA